MTGHVERDKLIDREEHNRRERVMNAHGKQMSRILKIGENGGAVTKKGCKDAMSKKLKNVKKCRNS